MDYLIAHRGNYIAICCGSSKIFQKSAVKISANSFHLKYTYWLLVLLSINIQWMLRTYSPKFSLALSCVVHR